MMVNEGDEKLLCSILLIVQKKKKVNRLKDVELNSVSLDW